VLVRVRASVVNAKVLKLLSDDETETVKSPTWTVIVREREEVPVTAVAVKVALCRPGVDDEMVHVDVAVPLAASVALVHVIVRPVPTPATLTVPAKF